MEEIFKTINYKDTEVTVSNKGKVIWNGKERNWRFNQDGYVVISIYINNRGWRNEAVHKIVARAFVENPDPANKVEVHHKDFNRKNPNADNLIWVTHEENVRLSKQNRPNINGDKNPNWGNRKLSKIYAENKNLSKEKQSRPGVQNGRSTKLEMYYDGELIETFDYIRLGCEYLKKNVVPNANIESIRGRIQDSINKNTLYKKHYSFKRVS